MQDDTLFSRSSLCIHVASASVVVKSLIVSVCKKFLYD